MCVTWLTHMHDMTHSHAWHDSFIHATWLVQYLAEFPALHMCCVYFISSNVGVCGKCAHDSCVAQFLAADLVSVYHRYSYWGVQVLCGWIRVLSVSGPCVHYSCVAEFPAPDLAGVYHRYWYWDVRELYSWIPGTRLMSLVCALFALHVWWEYHIYPSYSHGCVYVLRGWITRARLMSHVRAIYLVSVYLQYWYGGVRVLCACERVCGCLCVITIARFLSVVWHLQCMSGVWNAGDVYLH